MYTTHSVYNGCSLVSSQIETNRNTALTLACFQGRHEVVNLLVERQANVEHRAKVSVGPNIVGYSIDRAVLYIVIIVFLCHRLVSLP